MMDGLIVQIQNMEALGYSRAVRALLEEVSKPAFASLSGRAHAFVPSQVHQAYKILELEGDSIWEFLRAKAYQGAYQERQVQHASSTSTCITDASCGACTGH